MASDDIPRDVAPATGLTLEAVEALNAASRQRVQFTRPGAVITDADGIPLAVAPSHTEAAVLGGITLTRGQVERLGGDPDDYPNITFTTTGATS